MRIGILQPGYLPWLGFFEQIHKSDVFVIYDDVQYDKNGWRNRNKIKTPQGEQWLTVPVLQKFSEHPPINKIRIDNTTGWAKKHLLSIKQNYSKAQFYKDYAGIFDDAYARQWEYLIDINMYFIQSMLECLGMGGKEIVMSSSLKMEGDRIGRLINICRHFGADTFYEGAAGKNYIPQEEFLKNGIKVEFQDYKHPVYKQLYGGFTPQLSIIDLLFNNGKKSISILTGST